MDGLQVLHRKVDSEDRLLQTCTFLKEGVKNKLFNERRDFVETKNVHCARRVEVSYDVICEHQVFDCHQYHENEGDELVSHLKGHHLNKSSVFTLAQISVL